MLRKIIRTAAVFLLTGLLAVTAVTTYVTVPDETAADEETQAEETGTTESVTASFLAGRQDVYVTVESTCTDSGEALLLDGGYDFRVGQTTYVRGPGYMGSGPVTEIVREAEG